MKRINQMEPWLGDEEREEILKVLESGWITEAAKTKEFEEAFARFTGAKHATATVNGTVTLSMALWALGVGPGDEVIVPDFTMVASPNAVLMTGATPVLVDVRREDFCIDLDAADRAVTPRTKAVMPVHLNGRSPDMPRLMRWAASRGLYVVEDAAQALGCWHGDKHLGTWGHVGSFSLSTPKVITTGQGGVLTTDDPALHQRLYEIKDFGRATRTAATHDSLGYNFKFTDFQAAVGVAQMRKLPWRLERKKEMFRLCAKELADVPGVEVPATDLGRVAPWFIDVLLPDEATRARVQKHLSQEQIGTRPFYAPCHEAGPYKAKGGSFPVTEEISRRGLWLPSSTFLTDEDVLRVCDAVRRAMKAA